MHFKDSQQAFIVIEKLSQQREKGDFCDIVLTVNNQKFRAHRNVLAACSKHFHEAFKKQKTVKERVIIDRCKNIDSFKTVLSYIYTGAIVIDWDNVSDVLCLGDKLYIDKIKEYCEIYLGDHINISSCLKIRDLVLKHKLVNLYDRVIDFINLHIGDILVSDEIIRLSSKQLESFLKDNKCCFPQQELLKFLFNWVNHNIESRENSFKKFLPFINWQEIEQACLKNYFSDFPLFSNSPKCLYFLLNALDNNHMDLHGLEDTFRTLCEEFRNESTEERAIELPNFTRKAIPDLSGPLAFDKVETFESDNNTIRTNYLDTQSKNTEVSTLPLKMKKSRKSAHPQKIVNEPKRKARKKLVLMKETTSENCIKIVAKENISSSSSAENDYSDHQASNSGDLFISKTRAHNLPRSRLYKNKDRIRCDKCPYSAKDSANLEQHIYKEHSTSATFKCKFCDFVCSRKRKFNSHLQSHYEGPPFNCDQCKYTSSNIRYLLSHLKSHSTDRPYICDQCGNKYRRRDVLDLHMQTHSGEKPFQCDQCEMRFTSKKLLYAHHFTHTAEKPFLCHTCGFSTKLKRRLTYHMRTHTGDVIYCEFPDCKFSAPWKSEVLAHEKIHYGVKSHICSFCGAGFVAKRYLTKHERIHLNENPFKCEHCDYATIRNDKLKEHVQKHHSIGSPQKGSFRPRKQRLVRVCADDQNKLDKPSVRPTSSSSSEISHQATLNSASAISSNSNNNQNVCIYGVAPVALNYECQGHSSMTMNRLASVSNYQTVVSQAGNMQYMRPSLPPPVPVISHEIPTKFRSFMSFM